MVSIVKYLVHFLQVYYILIFSQIIMRRVILISLSLLTFLLPTRISNANDTIKNFICPDNGTINIIIKKKTLFGTVYCIVDKIKFKHKIQIDINKYKKKFPNEKILVKVKCNQVKKYYANLHK